MQDQQQRKSYERLATNHHVSVNTNNGHFIAFCREEAGEITLGLSYDDERSSIAMAAEVIVNKYLFIRKLPPVLQLAILCLHGSDAPFYR